MNTQKKNINWFWKFACILSVVLSGAIGSNAQVLCGYQNPVQTLSPFVKIISVAISETEPGPETGYWDSGMLMIEENLKICRDFFVVKPEIDADQKIINRKPAQDSITTKANAPHRIIKKKKPRSFRNYPGNTRTRI